MKKMTYILNGKIELAELIAHMKQEGHDVENELKFNEFGKIILTEGTVANGYKFEITLNPINGNINRYIDDIKVGKCSIFEHINYNPTHDTKENLVAEVANLILDHSAWDNFYYQDDGQNYQEDVFLFAHLTTDTDAEYFARVMEFMFDELVASNLEYEGVNDKRISRLRRGVAQLTNA